MAATRDSSDEPSEGRPEAGIAELEEALDAHRAILDTFEDGVFFADPDGVFVKANAAACRQLGYSADELLGMSLATIIVRKNFDFGAVRERLKSAGRLTYESVHRRKSGEEYPVQVTLTSVPDLGEWRMVGIARDLTEQRRVRAERERAETALRQSERQYRMLADHLPDMVARFDREHRLRYVNPTVEHQSGLSADALAGKTNFDIGLSPDKATAWQVAIECAFDTGQSQRLETDITGPHGVRYWDARLVPERGADGSIESVLAISRDVTERRQREEELQRKNEELMRFTYAVSHDLRSPLVTIKSFLAFLEQDIGTKDAAGIERDLGYIRNAAVRMGRLLDELLELSRVGRHVRAPEWVSLQDLAREATALVAGRIATTRTLVEVTEMPVVFHGDRARLIEIFQNLLDNAVKFSAGGEAPRVVIGAEAEGNETVVSVADNGIGIDPRHVHKLFGLFEKLHPEAEGTGIGLALVKRIVEVHGGRIWVESPGVGQGTTVSFTLPRTKRDGRAGESV